MKIFPAAILVAAFLAGCPAPPVPSPAPAAPDAGPSPLAGRALKILNQCADTVWIQQQGHTGSPAVTKLAKGGTATYPIPDAGLPSVRYWPKTGCDDTGNNCKVGQSSPPCPPAGCAPPVDSKLEATWGCTLPKEQCVKTAQGHHVGDTFWNASAVDGYTLPFKIDASQEASGCTDVECSLLDIGKCPASEDLSQGLAAKHPEFSAVDLRVAGEEGACYSPCAALTYPTFGGKGVQPPSADAPAPYCCPTPPVSPAQCSSGPVIKTKYVDAVHAACHKTAYGYAYDDTLGLRQCDPKVEVTMVLCPGIPAVVVPAPMGGG